MAEERNLGLARATDTTGDEDRTKAELQRRMEEARESITQTVTEIKDTVANQYQSVRDSFTEALDWREQFRKRPIAFSVGALSVGFIVGYSIAGAFKGNGYETYPAYEEEDESGLTERGPSSAPRSYAAQAITGATYGSSPYEGRETSPGVEGRDRDYRPLTRISDEDRYESREEEPDKPGLIERFKETRAYDRLQQEVSTLGDRFIDELSKAATTVVLPALFAKIKDYIGVDLSGKRQSQAGAGSQQRANTGSSGGPSRGAQASSGGGTDYNRGTEGRDERSPTYGTSENRGYSVS